MVCEREGEMFQEKETDGKQIAEESKSRTDVKIIEQQVCSSPFSPFFFFFFFLTLIVPLSFAHTDPLFRTQPLALLLLWLFGKYFA